MTDKFINLGGLPDGILDHVHEASSEIIKILINKEPKICSIILVSVLAKYLYQFEECRELLSGISRSVEQSFKAFDCDKP